MRVTHFFSAFACASEKPLPLSPPHPSLDRRTHKKTGSPKAAGRKIICRNEHQLFTRRKEESFEPNTLPTYVALLA